MMAPGDLGRTLALNPKELLTWLCDQLSGATAYDPALVEQLAKQMDKGRRADVRLRQNGRNGLYRIEIDGVK